MFSPKQLSCHHKFSFLEIFRGGQSSAAVKRPHGNVQDVGSNPGDARNENQTLGTPPAESSSVVSTGSQWKTGDISVSKTREPLWFKALKCVASKARDRRCK